VCRGSLGKGDTYVAFTFTVSSGVFIGECTSPFRLGQVEDEGVALPYADGDGSTHRRDSWLQTSVDTGAVGTPLSHHASSLSLPHCSQVDEKWYDR
jgi:hypothetical protein